MTDRPYPLFRLLDLIRLCCLGISHLLVLGGCLLCHGSLSCCFGHLTLLCCLSFRGGLSSGSFLLDLVEVALNDWTSNGADLVNLGDVDGLCGIFAFIVEPVLVRLENPSTTQNPKILPHWPQAWPS